MTSPDSATPPATALHWPSLTCALGVMLLVTVYPPALTDSAGRADHGLASLWMGAMSAGFVRGVGFIPRTRIWRLLFSGWACAALCLAAVVLTLLR